MTKKDPFPILSLVLWTALFLLYAKFYTRPESWAALGFTTLIDFGPEGATLWGSILGQGGRVVILGAVLLGLHRLWFARRRFPKVEFLLWCWAPAVGAWVALERCLRGVGADWVARAEPLLLTWVFPLSLIALGRFLGGVFGLLPIASNPSRSPWTYYLIVTNLLGASGWSILLYLLSLLGYWNVWILWIPVLCAAGLGVACLRRDLPPLTNGDRSQRPASGETWFLLFAILLILTAAIQLSFLPPDESDELRYHLSIPKRYLEAGGRVEIPDRAFAHFPLGMETLFALPTSLDWLRPSESRLGLAGGAKFVHTWFFILCFMTVYLGAREFSDYGSFLWGPLIFVSIGFAPVLAAWAFVDFGKAFGWLSSLLFTWFYFHKKQDPPEDQSALYFLTAIGLGWSLMVKYTSLAWWVLLVGFWIIALAVRRKYNLRAVVVLAMAPLLLASPWLTLNWLETGNPFYPLLSSVFGAGFDPVQRGFYAWHAGMKGNLNGFWDLSIPRQALDLLSLPFRAALYPPLFEFNPIGGLIPCLLPAFLIGFWGRRGQRAAIAAVTFALFLLWGLTYRDPRFAIPLWGGYAALAGVGIAETLSRLPGVAGWRILRIGLVGFLLFAAVSQSDEVLRRAGRYRDWILWAKPPEEYLRSRLPFHDTIREVERLRKLEPETPNLLLLGMEQAYYFDSPLRGADYFDGPWLADLARDSTSVEEISERIRGEGIDWIFVNRDTLENNDANVARGALFCLDAQEAAEALAEARHKNLAGLRYTPAFKRMHAWLVRFPGFAEVSLDTSRPGRLPISKYYREWAEWPEFAGVSLDDLPRRRYSLLAPVSPSE